MGLKIAIQGVKASFHEEASFKYFGEDIETIECDTFKKTCELLKQKKVDYVVMAIENSIAGSILPNYNLLRDYKFNIVGEIALSIHQNLLALPGVKLADIKFIESHQMAIRQCEEFLQELPDVKISESSDTAASAAKVANQKLTDTAAIAGTLAAKTYGLNILEAKIETNKKNSTRFLVLSNDVEEQASANKASLSFQTGNSVGSLASILQCFADQNINLSKIQSMPVIGKRNEYDFFVDVEWKKQSDYDAAIRKVLKHSINFNIMGEYVKNDRI
ncbi:MULTISPECIES: prephenate dehydratase [Sphingobacterium]|jgi:prephenate dehydratase|uniref:prephenate dehydratase n=2 Tax=Sphingobacterium TaxID=28453 RepID=A0ABW5YXK8_9SPHI|nr:MULTISPECIES: prephenate dehydratase [Sphingobacterium]MBB2949645.1 prephenate dehydratase [Sphingobacterium sp. JUb56]MCS3554369.1 prephenate dehydratase [Sphingobacterium sp. JUb21]MCW2263514.1 prephenate dehydratase [Sphingobacterium kitahiroshimense]NJI74359.1 prephenate dehydratase [Sphingobacterium sp. B16(2022)]QQD14196.1 prephenate dehydratase [Sphingobacterium sp. UDSM-2020]